MTALHHTRLKLTAWYLLIIMVVSITFSIAFYLACAYGVDHIVAGRYLLSRGGRSDYFLLPSPLRNELEDFKTLLRFALVIINGFIFVFAGGAGYFLAGRTLRPIRDMIDEQNRFITDASHELKTPLTVLRTEFEVAMLDGENIPHESAVQLIKSGFDEIVELQRLTENLLELTRQHHRKNSIAYGEVSLLEIIEAALKNVIPLAKQKHITIQNEIDDYILAGESSSLGELFTILLDNAIKYSPNSKEIKIASRKSDHHIDVTVSDQGTGINEKDLPHIFERFYRADKSRSKISGYGLGLSIAREIVKSHKGAISVQSKFGQGTTFTVQLPLKKSS
ncbi:MAG TPA: HAMP domain-containing sensor histidine kinase [Chloroflexia bacterium]|nr:HAMP domain-containing sensor histidine kinase [Chloroflexia bacterium]